MRLLNISVNRIVASFFLRISNPATVCRLPALGLAQQHRRRLGRPHPRPGATAVELSKLRRTWSAEFIPLPADLPVPWGSGLKSALLNSTAVRSGPLKSDRRARTVVRRSAYPNHFGSCEHREKPGRPKAEAIMLRCRVPAGITEKP